MSCSFRRLPVQMTALKVRATVGLPLWRLWGSSEVIQKMKLWEKAVPDSEGRLACRSHIGLWWESELACRGIAWLMWKADNDSVASGLAVSVGLAWGGVC